MCPLCCVDGSIGSQKPAWCQEAARDSAQCAVCAALERVRSPSGSLAHDRCLPLFISTSFPPSSPSPCSVSCLYRVAAGRLAAPTLVSQRTSHGVCRTSRMFRVFSSLAVPCTNRDLRGVRQSTAAHAIPASRYRYVGLRSSWAPYSHTWAFIFSSRNQALTEGVYKHFLMDNRASKMFQWVLDTSLRCMRVFIPRFSKNEPSSFKTKLI